MPSILCKSHIISVIVMCVSKQLLFYFYLDHDPSLLNFNRVSMCIYLHISKGFLCVLICIFQEGFYVYLFIFFNRVSTCIYFNRVSTCIYLSISTLFSRVSISAGFLRVSFCLFQQGYYVYLFQQDFYVYLFAVLGMI